MKTTDIRNFIRKSTRFGLYIPQINLIGVYVSRILPDKLLSALAHKRNVKIQRRLTPILDKILNDTTEYQQTATPLPSSPIWFCWLQGENEMPPLVKVCLDSIRRNSAGHPAVIVTEANHRDHVTLDPIVYSRYKSGALKKAHFADMLRINLLAQKGGLWLDATMFVAKEFPTYVFDLPFFSIKTKPVGHFVSRCRWAVFCLGSHKGNPLFAILSELFNEYLRQHDTFIDYFLFDQFIDMLYKRIHEIAMQVDAVPYSNPDLYELQRVLTQRFDDNSYRKMTSDTFMFKLSLKQYTADELEENQGNFYHHIASIQ